MWNSWNHGRCTLKSMGFQNWTKRCMPAAQTESYTTDSGGIQGKHKVGSLSGMHMESCSGRGTSKPWSIKIWVGQRWSCQVPLHSSSITGCSSCTSRITQNDPVQVQQWSALLVSQKWMWIWSASLSLFCKCGGSDSYCNQMTKKNMVNDANDDEEHGDDGWGDEDDD